MRRLLTTLLALALTSTTWASVDSFGTNANVTGTYGATKTYPLSLVIWANCTGAGWSSTSLQYIVDFHDQLVNADEGVGIVITPGVADRTQARAGDMGSATGLNSYTSATDEYDDTWVMMAAVFASSTSQAIAVENSANKVTSSATRTAAALDEVIVGTRWNGTGNPAPCKLAEFAIFDVELVNGHIDALQIGDETGVKPCLVAPDNCIGYWSYDTDQETHADESGNSGPTLTENSTAEYNADHPTIVDVSVNTLRRRRGNL